MMVGSSQGGAIPLLLLGPADPALRFAETELGPSYDWD